MHVCFFFLIKKKRFNYVAGKSRALSQIPVRNLLTKYKSLRSTTLDSGITSPHDLFSPSFPFLHTSFQCRFSTEWNMPIIEAIPLPPAVSSYYLAWTRTNGHSLACSVRWSHPSSWNINLQKSKIKVNFQLLIHLATWLYNCYCWHKWSRSKRWLKKEGEIYSFHWPKPLG